ncbi:CHD5-like protein-domain-containing protein [Syncephalis pseudoplumigaleata]|uniref:CHD5-like protein-domain-containing protein n=1 Tax=Syncephalis pseudoplumigaleata TaxID=1712513 RepID=A0A4P9YY72_9FUNG|nr:CHD5-like protein-domain-containing protein [Syncephalis pseudoplumigaleata]|eukprot:RKP24898.1 CHD5-like protein-domain-containing protein [Syncephalis pseudoplumigaleata]
MQLATLILLLVITSAWIHIIGYGRLGLKLYEWRRQLLKSGKYEKQRQCKRTVLKLKNQLRQTSPHDEFAKWAKIRRRLDKTVSEYEELSSSLAYERTGFQIRAAIGIRVLLWAARFFVLIWYRAEPVFYPPTGWLDPVLPLLSFPLAPYGSVSVAVWLLVCTQVVDLCLRAYRVVQPESGAVPVITTTAPAADAGANSGMEGIRLDEKHRK